MELLQPFSIPVRTNFLHCRHDQVRNQPGYIDGLEANLHSIPRSQIRYKPYRLARSMYVWDQMAGVQLELELEEELELEWELELELEEWELELELEVVDLECMGLPLSRPLSMLPLRYRLHFDQV